MKMNIVFAVISIIFFSYCGQPQTGINKEAGLSFDYINTDGNTIQERFPAPPGFGRMAADSKSFTFYLRNLPLKPHGSQVYLYNGQLKGNQDAHVAVIDIDVGTNDLQQCADAVMRLRAEYLYKNGMHEKISFHFTNGFEVPWSKYSQGYRVAVNGNKTSWVMKSKPGAGYKDFRNYMNLIFTYAGSLSLSKELSAKSINEIEPGDVFIVGGSPGHAVIVIDVVENPEKTEKKFLLAQSYMPAQEIHVLKNPASDDDSPWYSSKTAEMLLTPEWLFNSNDLKKF
jgi:hypothetical protein